MEPKGKQIFMRVYDRQSKSLNLIGAFARARWIDLSSMLLPSASYTLHSEYFVACWLLNVGRADGEQDQRYDNAWKRRRHGGPNS